MFGRTGHIQLLGWNRSALFGQFLILGPLARWLEAQQAFVAVMALLGLIAIYDLLVPSVGRRRAAFGCVIVAGWPSFGLLSTTFMLDIPAMASMMICLALGRRAAVGRSTRLLALSALIGLWGFTIREQVVAAPFAVLIAAAVAHRKLPRLFRWSSLTAIGLIYVAMAGIFEVWRQSYSAGNPPVISITPDILGLVTQQVVRAYFLLALGLAPAVFLVSRPWRWTLKEVAAGSLVLGVAVAAVHDFSVRGFFLGNYISLSGPYWQAGNGIPAPIFPMGLWRAAVIISCSSGVLLAPLILRRYRNLGPLLAIFVAAMVIGNLATAIMGQSLFDRYWLPVLPPLLVIVLSDRCDFSAHDSGRMVGGFLSGASAVVERHPR